MMLTRHRRMAVAPSLQSADAAGQRFPGHEPARLRTDATHAPLSRISSTSKSKYERRPSLWVEPIGDWAAGAVELYEIPTEFETNDNIVAFWRPKETLKQGGSNTYVYRLHWCATWPTEQPAPLALVSFSGSGVDYDYASNPPKYDPNLRMYVIEFAGGPTAGELSADVTASAGTISKVVVYENDPRTTRHALSFAPMIRRGWNWRSCAPFSSGATLWPAKSGCSDGQDLEVDTG